MQVTYKTPIAANGNVRNALADTDLAIAPYFGFLTVYGRQEETSGGELELSLTMGDTQVAIESPMTINDNLTPNREHDIISGPHPVLAGKSLRAKIQEVAGFITALNVVFVLIEADRTTVLRASGLPV